MEILTKDQIMNLADFDAVVEAVEQSYIAVSSGAATIPPVGYLHLPQHNGDCHIKIGHLHGDPIFLVKIATGFYDNTKLGISTSNGIMIALSAVTGEVAAILQDEGYLTDLRTAIGAAIATKALASTDARRLLIVGAGIQAEQQIRSHAELLKDRSPEFAIWARDAAKARGVALKLREEGFDVKPALDLQTACSNAQIILTTTPSRNPIVLRDWVQPGTHITATGADAPGKCELDPELVAAAECVVADSIDQCIDHGEISNASVKGLLQANDVLELGNVLAESSIGRQHANDISVVDLTGLASQDIAAARTVLQAFETRQK